MSMSFLMPITCIASNKTHSQTISFQGVIQFGSIKIGDTVTVCSLSGQSIQTIIIDTTSTAEKDAILTLPPMPEPHTYIHGFIFKTAYPFALSTKFIGQVRFLPHEQGGRSQTLILTTTQYPSYEVIVKIYGQTYLVRPVPFNDNVIVIEPGHTVDLQIDLSNRYLPLELGSLFTLQEGAKIIAEGVITDTFNHIL